MLQDFVPDCQPIDVVRLTTSPLNRPTAVLTVRGAVAVQVIRLGYALEDLAGEDRAFIVGMLRDLIEDAGA
jgi:hypothetical protein